MAEDFGTAEKKGSHMMPIGKHGDWRRYGRALVIACLVTVLSAPVAADPWFRGGAHERVRFHGFVQWIAGSKLVVWADAGGSVTVDLSEVDLASYRGVLSGDGITVEAEFRPKTHWHNDSIALVAKKIEPDAR
jgi:hypothetical protein